jgi:hypothetical protein
MTQCFYLKISPPDLNTDALALLPGSRAWSTCVMFSPLEDMEDVSRNLLLSFAQGLVV